MVAEALVLVVAIAAIKKSVSECRKKTDQRIKREDKSSSDMRVKAHSLTFSSRGCL